MYSVVLMAALTTSVDLPDSRGGCHGCRGGGHGCRGGGYGCCGCGGGGYGGGGYGGCMGMSYGGGYGGGCMGMGMGYGGCTGMSMGHGGCTGMGYGGCMGGMTMMGGMGMGGMMMQGGTIQQGEPIKKKPTTKEEEARVPTPATIVVQLPADAKLLIENEATTSTGVSRVFQSPALNPGKEYNYTLTAEVVRNGKSVKIERVVAVKAGQTTPVTLTEPSTGVAQR